MRRRCGVIGLAIIVGFGGLLVLILMISEPVQAQTWTVLVVDDTHAVRGHTSIAMDSEGVPHIIHNEMGPNNLRHVTKSGILWNSEVVDTGNIGIYQFRYTSIALDSNDYPHISYYYDATDDLKYARWDGNAWNVEYLDTTGDVGGFSSLALDNNGYPHIAYYDETNDDLKYTRWDGVAWNTEVVDWVSSVGAYSSLELDTSGFPHISYYNATGGDLMYAKWNGGSWEVETVDSWGNVGKWTSLALDANDHPHISYYDVSNGDLRYAKWTGSAWDYQGIPSVFDVGQYTSIDVDSGGNAHICYFDVSNGDLEYVFIAGMTWDVHVVDTPGVVGKWASLALDANDHPHISYYDETKVDIKYATTAPLPPTEPQNFEGTPADEQITLSWTQPASDGGFPITNYRVYHGVVPGNENLLVELGIEFSYVHSGLTNGQMQYYFVTAINSIGEGLPSDRIGVAPATTPRAPQNLTARPGDGFVNLSWDAPSYDGDSMISNYTVYRGLFSGGESFLVELAVEYSYNDTSVTNGVTYFYNVTAKNALGEGESSTITATPGILPSEPRNLTSQADDSVVDLTWDPPQFDGGSAITNYLVCRGLASEGET
ncbi:MAG: fibronectin type III domain-containing protein, partial [Thermoplasmata archaeon]